MANIVSPEVLEAFKDMIRDGVGKVLEDNTPSTCIVAFSDLLRNDAEITKYKNDEFHKNQKNAPTTYSWVLTYFQSIKPPKELEYRQAKDAIVAQFVEEFARVGTQPLQQYNNLPLDKNDPVRQNMQKELYKDLKKSMLTYFRREACNDSQRPSLDALAKSVTPSLVDFIKGFNPNAPIKENKTTLGSFAEMIRACNGMVPGKQ